MDWERYIYKNFEFVLMSCVHILALLAFSFVLCCILNYILSLGLLFCVRIFGAPFVKVVPSIAKRKYMFDRIPLHLFLDGDDLSSSSSPDIIRALIAAYPKGIYQKDELDYTPIELAIETETFHPNSIHREIFDILFRASPSYPRQKLPRRNQYPLSYLFFYGSACPATNIILPRLECFPLAAQEKVHGLLPIHRACDFQDVSEEVVDALLKAFPQGAGEQGLGKLPIFQACENGASLEVVTALIKVFPQGVIALSSNNRSPLNCAVHRRQPNLHVIGALVEAAPSTLLQMVRSSNNNNNNEPTAITMLQSFLVHGRDQVVDNNNQPIRNMSDILIYLASKAIRGGASLRIIQHIFDQGQCNIHGTIVIREIHEQKHHRRQPSSLFEVAIEEINNVSNMEICSIVAYLLQTFPMPLLSLAADNQQPQDETVQLLLHRMCSILAMRKMYRRQSSRNVHDDDDISAVNILYSILKLNPAAIDH